MCLLDAVDELRFVATCSGWAKGSKSSVRLKSGVPALLTSSNRSDGYWAHEVDFDAGGFGLHRLSDRATFPCTSRGFEGRRWIGGKNDWVVTQDRSRKLYLQNPVTSLEISLPRFYPMNGGSGVDVEYEMAWPNRMHVNRVERAVLCRTPSHPEGYFVIAIFSWDLMAFTSAKDSRWTALAGGMSKDCYFMDAILQNSSVQAVTIHGDIFSWDLLGNLSEPVMVSRPHIDIDSNLFNRKIFFLALSSINQVMLVCLYGYGWRCALSSDPNRVQSYMNVVGILIYELDAMTLTWREVNAFGGHQALFIGGGHHFFISSVPDDTDGYLLLRKDSVYISDMIDCQAAIFDLDPGNQSRYERLHFPVVKYAMQMPMWFRPSYHSV